VRLKGPLLAFFQSSGLGFRVLMLCTCIMHSLSLYGVIDTMCIAFKYLHHASNASIINCHPYVQNKAIVVLHLNPQNHNWSTFMKRKKELPISEVLNVF